MAVQFAAIAAAIQAGIGVAQLLKAKSMEANRPTATINPSRKNARDLAMLNYVGSGNFGAEEAQLQGNVASAIEATRGNPMAAQMIPSIISAQNGATNQLAIAARNERRNALAGYMNAEQNFGGELDRVWQYNYVQKYIEDAQAKSAMTGAGLQNVQGGINSGASIADTNAYLGAMKEMYAVGQAKGRTPEMDALMGGYNPLAPTPLAPKGIPITPATIPSSTGTPATGDPSLPAALFKLFNGF